ncbi:MAG TPA: hypothetical protein DCW41_00780 [Clostridiales bacterium]|nr:hypothetical protein [Clostridiales bacterium]
MKRGKWTRISRLFAGDIYECSLCKGRFSKPSSTCPKCKASMTPGKYDPRWVDDMEFLDAIFDD